MTIVDERRPFEPVYGDGLRATVHLAIAAHLPALEPGTLITYDMLSDWLGRPFPFPTANGLEYRPMDQVRYDLLDEQGVWLLSIVNVGYQVATHAEKVLASEQRAGAAQFDLAVAGKIARSVSPAMVSPTDAARAAELARDVQENLRVLRSEQRARARTARQWTQETG
jgi:hypothetical protein